MPEKSITIKVTKEVKHKDGSPPWRVGARIITTHEELKQRNVPKGSYEVVDAAPAPGTLASTTTEKSK